ncbi:MAG: CaiB/BaiF CoA-transferase family protein [Dehalococcoidales bacterium]|jgi:crotonobetainyl-CoA:carnitine CoA-transferase CaiB-like acyl-CoA transferase
MAGVLERIKVIDFTQVYSGPYCTLLLKDLGADVIKVERPESGDLIRYDIPHTEGNEGGPFIILNRGKKSLTVDLKTEKGRNICKKLIKDMDVLVENFSPGTMDKLGLGSKEICKLNPKLIYASISAYGQTGPRRDYPGFDPVAQAMGGMTDVTGFPDKPTRCGVSIADFSSGFFATLSIVSALYHRLKTGEGQTIDISMQDCIWQLTSIEFAPYYWLNHVIPPRLGNGHAAMIPCNLYTAKDGGKIYISAGVLAQVHRLYTAMGRADLINTPLGANQNERFQHRQEIDDIIAAWVKTKTTQEITELLKKSDVPCTRLPSFDEVCNDPQLMSRNMIIEVDQPISGKVKVPGSLFKMSKTPGKIDMPAPFLGENNQEILAGMLGYTEEEISKLSDERVI